MSCHVYGLKKKLVILLKEVPAIATLERMDKARMDKARTFIIPLDESKSVWFLQNILRYNDK